MIQTVILHDRISQAIRRTYQKPTGFTIQNVRNGAKDLAAVYEAAAEAKRLNTIPKAKVLDVYTEIICEYFGLPADLVRAVGRKREVVIARQIICYFAKLKGITLDSCGKYFNQDHTTIMSSIRQVNALIDTDPDYKATVNEIENKLK